MDDRDDYIRQMNQRNADLERRNGELFAALQSADAEAAAFLTPRNGAKTRFVRIGEILDAIQHWYYVRETDPDEDDAGGYLLDEMSGLYREFHDYWILSAQRADETARRNAGRLDAARAKRHPVPS